MKTYYSITQLRMAWTFTHRSVQLLVSINNKKVPKMGFCIDLIPKKIQYIVCVHLCVQQVPVDLKP